jgi:hypothetical protein
LRFIFGFVPAVRFNAIDAIHSVERFYMLSLAPNTAAWMRL